MKTVSLSGSPRENVGKKDAKAIRQKGHVPCVVYGGKDQIHFSTNEKSFKNIVFTPEACFVEIDLDGKKYLTILQDVQYHPVSDKILHADFMEITENRYIKLDIPVRLEGTSPGVLKGGRLVQKMRKLPIRALSINMPQEIVVNIGKLNINDKIKAVNVKSDKYELMLNDNTVIVMIMKSRITDAVGTDDEDEGTEDSAAK